MSLSLDKLYVDSVFFNIQFHQGGTHCQGVRSDEGGVRLQVTIFLVLTPIFICFVILSFHAMFLIDPEGVVVARQVSFS